MSGSVVFSKSYLNDLSRRPKSNPRSEFIKISVRDYTALLRDGKEYSALRNALFDGGVAPETLDTLVKSALASQTPNSSPSETYRSAEKHEWSTDDTVTLGDQENKADYQDQNATGYSFSSATSPLPYHRKNGAANEHIEQAEDGFVEDSDDTNDIENVPDNRPEKRSIIIKSLPENTTLCDVLSIVRGGMVLNAYIRRHENSAVISFVDPEAAANFVIRSKRHDVYVKDKRVLVIMDHKNTRLPDHISKRLNNQGASRNFVIRFIVPGTTAARIRNDLDHIHQLEVVRLTIEDGHAWISLNGIQHAITATHCMRSRLQYRNLHFEFCHDECDQPISEPVKPSFSTPKMPITCKPDIEYYRNKFNALLAETSEYLDEECEDEVSC